MITCHLKGGLGNQLFQIFTTVVYAFKQKSRFCFTNEEMLFIGHPRRTYWNDFLNGLKQFTIPNIYSHFNNQFEYVEKTFHYSQIPNIDREKIILNGYFQSYKYFHNDKDVLFRLIRLQQQKDTVFQEYSNFFLTENTIVSMHFRLGDYKNVQQFHPILPYTYYERALKTLPNNSRILYLCEEQDENIVNKIIGDLKIEYPDMEFIKIPDSICDWKQLIIMSLCRVNIIANSTFSWWGAYFNTNDNKIVKYPSIWFGSKLSHNNLQDLFLDTWEKVEI